VNQEDFNTVRGDLYAMDKRLALLEQKVTQIDRNVEKIASALGWIVKITGGGLLTGITAWIIKGGLGG